MIKRLYEKGPHARGAQTPSDEWQQLKRDTKGEIHDILVGLPTALDELRVSHGAIVG